MGACGSKAAPGKGAAPATSAKPQAAPKAERKKLNPADYIISKKIGETVIKEEGTIAGEQFNIEECKDCDIFLLDYIATAFIDDCKGCRIFVGPIESSIFIRNCSSCSFIVACQQFRCRDCTDCNLALLCTTEPIIETSENMKFACFDFNYFSLRGQLNQAGLKLWNNKWSQVYDFNKNSTNPNWSLLPQEEVPKLLNLKAVAGIVSPEELQNDRAVPVTLGSRPRPSPESCFVVFLPDSEAFVEAFLAKATKTEGWILCRTRATALVEEQLKGLFAGFKEPKLPSQCKGKEVIGVEVCGGGIWQKVQDAISLTGLASGSKNIRIIAEKDSSTLAKLFFETWKDEV